MKRRRISGLDSPYIVEHKVTIEKVVKYNPNYGDNRKCKCGHSYYRHFDSWEDMFPCGCKYCRCDEFVEDKGEENNDCKNNR